MGNSLRDQLLKAGLVDSKQARQAAFEDRQQSRQASKARKSGLTVEPTAAQVAAEQVRREQERQREQSRDLNRRLEEERARKALRAEVRQWLKEAAQPHGKGDVRYHLTHGTRVKRLHVDPEQKTQLTQGRLAVVAWDGAYYLVPPEVAERARQRVPDTFVFLARPEAADPDDPYAAYPIPPDLDW